PQHVLDLGPDLLGVTREDTSNSLHLVALHNVTPYAKSLPLGQVPMPPYVGAWADALTGETIDPHATELTFEPYQSMWLVPQVDCPHPEPLPSPTDQSSDDA
ncbi:MAG: hypothetical protein AAF213_12455, partial [Pseudomonadota bacterium]